MTHWDEREASKGILPGSLVRRNLSVYSRQTSTDAGLGIVLANLDGNFVVMWSGPREFTPMVETYVSVDWLARVQ